MIEEEILSRYHVVAMVGVSQKEDRPSYRVFNYLTEHGYEVIPVNPAIPEMMGKSTYPDLKSIPRTIEIVDIFRKSEEVMPVVEAAIDAGAKVVWMQEGVINEEAAAKARAAGLQVVMNKCMKKMHESIFKTSEESK
jgi:uncharacterized protein